ncbi:MAG: Ig-like domain-containing protein [Deltaproteobacteria bacterium]|nr:Ig-like domain-containing protein [Deltaproteobacteria bacterium]
MSVRLLRTSVFMLAACAASCSPTVTKDSPITVSAATLAVFAPDSAEPCNSVLPFPNDLAKDAATHRLNIPYCKTDSADQTGMKSGLRTLDGFALGTSLYTRFSAPIDPASAEAAVKVFNAATGAPVAVATQFDAAQNNTLFIQPLAPLAEGTKYLVAITTDLKDEGGKPVSPDQVFVFAKSPEPLVDELGYSRFPALPDDNAYALEQLRKGFAPMFEGLATLGVARESIAVAWAFTTQTVHASLPMLGQLVGNGPQVSWENSILAAQHGLIAAAGIPATNLCEVHSGRIALRSLLTSAGTFGVDAAGAPLVSTEVADWILITPNPNPTGDAGCAAKTPWTGEKVVVFAHGLGRCKNDALALANRLAAAGFAILTVDGPFAGARTLGALGDQDLDGCQDQPATPEFIALPGTSANPFAVRDHLREWALELSQIVAAAKASPYKFVGLSSGAAATKVAVVGHSWGGMAVSLGSHLFTGANAVAVHAASAELGAVFAPGVRQSIAAQLAAAGVNTSAEPGLTMLNLKTAESVAAFRWALEPGDPLYGAAASSSIPTPIPTLVQVVAPGGTMAEAPLHAADTQKKLAAAFKVSSETLAKTSFELTLSGASLCDDGTSAVGALLMPCMANTAAATYPAALAKTAGMQRQLVTFLASASAGAPLICDPDYTKPCQ